MASTESTFYVTGGTLRQDAACYVERQADKDLLDGLLKGEFCYVLTSRQMGKSSLMVRTAGKLREQGINVAVLDLTAIGQNLTPEQWYDGLLVRAGRQLRLEDELEDYWTEHPRVSPVQRLFNALREVALVRRPGKLVIFVDEIDTVRSLPFTTDEFFAAMRECYNRRTEDVEFTRLTFCLLGVATPSDLIRDTRTTPFNIGHRIELNDFTTAEAAPLARGLESSIAENAPPSTFHAPRLLDRILYWTGGHPYLTQRLCHAIGEPRARGVETDFIAKSVSQRAGLPPASSGDHSLSVTPETVDFFCEELFLSPRGRERDDNLLFVRERLLRSEVDLASLLELYLKARKGKPLPGHETNPLVTVLRLSGIVRTVEGRLTGRNRIYERVFDHDWVRANMPDAELRRQRAAYLRGLFRAAAAASIVVAIVSALFLYARHQAIVARKNLYDADLSLAGQAFQEGNLGRTVELLRKYQPGSTRQDLCGWEWRYLWSQTRSDELYTVGRHSGIVTALAFSPLTGRLASASMDGSVKIWDLQGRRELHTLEHPKPVRGVVFSADAQRLITACDDGTVRFWKVATWTLDRVLTNKHEAHSIALAPDNATLAVGSGTAMTLWDLKRDEILAQWQVQLDTSALSVGMAFSADHRLFAYAKGAGEIGVWDLAGRLEVGVLRGHSRAALCLSFSPDSRQLLSGSLDRSVRLWDLQTYREHTNLVQFASWVGAVAFSPDGKLLTAASADQHIGIWQTGSLTAIANLKGHSDEVWCLAFAPDATELFTGGKDETIRAWSCKAKIEKAPAIARFPTPSFAPRHQLSPEATVLLKTQDSGSNVIQMLWQTADLAKSLLDDRIPSGAVALAVSPFGRLLALTDPKGGLELWEIANRRSAGSLTRSGPPIDSCLFSSEGGLLAVASSDTALELWDVERKALVRVLAGQPSHVWRLAFSRNGRLFAAAYDSGVVSIANTRVNGPMTVFKPHKLAVMGLAFSYDGRMFATASADAKVKLWEVDTQRRLATLSGDFNMFGSVAFSPDGRRLAAGSGDGHVILWDLTISPPQEVAKMKGHSEEVEDLAFSEDGNTLFSVTRNDLRAWRAPSFEEVSAAEKELGRGK